MDFELTPEQKSLQTEIADLFGDSAREDLAAMENGDAAKIKKINLKYLGSLARRGYLKLGLDGDASTLLAARQTLAAEAPSLFLSVEVSARLFGGILAAWGTEKQKKEILQPLLEGKIVGAVAMSEGGMNIETAPIATEGSEGSAGLSIYGEKSQVVNGPVADWIAVAGKLSEKGGEGESGFFLIPTEAPGLKTGERFSTLGYAGTAISGLSLKDCSVSKENFVAPPEGTEAFAKVRDWENRLLTAASIGCISRCYNAALDYSKNHYSGKKPIIAYQEIGFKVADMLTLKDSSELMAWRAAWMESVGDKESSVLNHCAKVFCGEAAEKVASEAMQILGGNGFLRGNTVESGFRDSKYVQIAGTSTEIARMKIGDAVLEQYQ